MRSRVTAARVARLATITTQGVPHIVPFCFALTGDVVVTAVDAKPKSTGELRRLANIEANPSVSVLVDHYDDNWSQLWWVRLDASASVVRTGPKRDHAIDLLAEKYPQYRSQRPAGAVIILEVDNWQGWSHD